MTAEHYRNVLLKHWPLIILCSVLLGVGAAIGSLFVPPVYQSTVTIQLVIPSSDASLLGTTNEIAQSLISRMDQTLQTEVDLATSNSILTEVVTHYPGLTVEQLKSEVSAVALPNTRLFQITVSDRDPVRAAHLANDLAAALVAQQALTMQQVNAQSLQPLLDSLAATQKQIDTDTATLNSLQSNPSANQQQIQTLQNELSNLQKQHDQEQQTLADVQNAEARTTTFLQVAGAAQPSSKPLRSYLWIIDAAAGLGFGLLLGVLLVLLRDRFDQQIRSSHALVELTGWPILDEVGTPASDQAFPKDNAKQEGTQHPDAYHTLRQNLAFLGIETPLFSIAVTSTLADTKRANKIAGDLALALANEGKHVVLVDANLTRPWQHRRFGVPSEPGLGAAALAFNEGNRDEKSLNPYLYDIKNVPASLRIMPAGPIPPNPKQVLKSQAMTNIFQAFGATGADVVVLVSPPVTGSADTCALAAHADGVIVVIERPHARKEKLMQMKRVLEESGARVLGYVVSGEPPNQSKPSEQQIIESVPVA